MIGRTVNLYVNAYTGLSKPTWLLSLVMLVNRSGTMVIPFMTIYLTQPSMGYSIGQAGIVMGIFGVGAICGGFMGGWLTDRFGFFRVQQITLMGGGLLFMVLGQMRHFPSICVCTFLLSLVNEAFRPANSTAIAHYSKEENRTRSYSLNRLAINLGWALGGALGGLLASINYHLLFWVDGCTNILAALLLRYFLTEAAAGEPVAKPVAQKGPAVSAYRDRTYLEFIVYTTLFAGCFFQLFTILPVYFKHDLHMQEYMIGLLMALNGVLIACIEMVLVFQLEGKRQNLAYISLGVFLVGMSYLLLNILPLSVASAFGCILVVTFGEIMSMPFMNSFWVCRTVTANRGQYAGLYTIAWSVAQALGPFAGSQIAAAHGFRTLWWAAGGICILSALGFRWLRFKTNRVTT